MRHRNQCKLLGQVVVGDTGILEIQGRAPSESALMIPGNHNSHLSSLHVSQLPPCKYSPSSKQRQCSMDFLSHLLSLGAAMDLQAQEHTSTFTHQHPLGLYIPSLPVLYSNFPLVVSFTHGSGLPQGLSSKESPCNAGVAGDAGPIPGLRRSPG